VALLDVDEALARILARVREIGCLSVGLEQAGGRILRQDVIARRCQPPFRSSAMDGYALYVESDEVQAGEHYILIGEVAAGQIFDGKLGQGECVRIFTGAPVPENANTVVIQEDTRPQNQARIEITQKTKRGKNIRPAGGDFVEGAVVLGSGLLMTPARLALAAAAGYDALAVIPSPRVGILSTGDELVNVGQEPKAEQIIASNAVALAEIVRSHGGEVIDLGLVGDNRTALAEVLERAKISGLDILVISGGASVGDYDLVREALLGADVELDFWKVAMRPGKPLMFGLLPVQGKESDDIMVLGLPGNPVSSIVTAHLFLVPMLEKMQRKPFSFHLQPAKLKKSLEQNGSRRHYLRARMEIGADGEIWVEPAASLDSSLLSILAQSDCLIVVAEDAPAQKAGDVCQIFIPPHGL